jgi:hypothetical protein
MLKQVLLCSALITVGTIGAVSAHEPDQQTTFVYPLVFAEAAFPTTAVDTAVLAEITAWLAENFNLPATDEPRVAFVPSARIAAFRYRGFAQAQAAVGDDQATLEAGREIAAVYDDATRTIYLPDGWRWFTICRTLRNSDTSAPRSGKNSPTRPRTAGSAVTTAHLQANSNSIHLRSWCAPGAWGERMKR